MVRLHPRRVRYGRGAESFNALRKLVQGRDYTTASLRFRLIAATPHPIRRPLRSHRCLGGHEIG